MSLDCYPELVVEQGDVRTAEAVVSDDLVVKVFALGPGGEVAPHTHPGETNVFHVLSGRLTIVQGDSEEQVTAPGIVHHAPGVVHGARNDSDDTAIFSASLVGTEP